MKWSRGYPALIILHTEEEHIEREIEDLDDLKEILEHFFGMQGSDPPLRALDDQPGFN